MQTHLENYMPNLKKKIPFKILVYCVVVVGSVQLLSRVWHVIYFLSFFFFYFHNKF